MSAVQRPGAFLWAWLIALGLLAAAVKGGALIAADRAIDAWMEPLRTPGAVAAAKAITFFGSAPWALAAVAAMGGWWLARGRLDTLRVFLIAGAFGLLIQVGLRMWVAQWRPDAAAPATLDLAARYDLAGFTSGHAFRAAFLSGWWARALLERRTRWGKAGAAGLGLLAAAVGATRILLRRHWASDVAGGWLVALIALSLAFRLSRREDRSVPLPSG